MDNVDILQLRQRAEDFLSFEKHKEANELDWVKVAGATTFLFTLEQRDAFQELVWRPNAIGITHNTH